MKKISRLNLKTQKALHQEGVILVYLFGSQSSGYTHQDSDVDIAVLLDEKISPEAYFEKSLLLPKYFSDLFPKRAVSVIILNESPPLL